MKKHLLFGSALLAAIGSFSQTGSKVKPVGMVNMKFIANEKFADISAPIASPVKISPVKTRTGAKTSATNTWNSFTSSMNILGVVIPYSKPLQWNDELNAISFVHRKSPTYVMNPIPAPTAETGGIVTMISLNCGASWDSTALYTNDNFWGRYPNGAIYNPPMTPVNTDINNAYFVGAGPATGTSGGWIGNWYASKKLGTANYNNAPSTATNAVQVMPTQGPNPVGVPSRHDFDAYGFAATDDGKVRNLGGITDDVLTSDTAVMLMTGTFNNGVFDWTGKVFDAPTTIESDGTENWVSRPMMAWNEQGTVGYVVIIGSRLGSTGSNVGFQPIVYKTTNSGSTWSLETSINFNTATYNDVKGRLWGTNLDSTLKIPNFFWAEGIDCTVDANNKLHVFSSLLGHPSGDPDSLNFVSQWGTDRYRWPHNPIVDGGMALHPYLWDFIYDGTNASPAWSHILVDSMATEGAAGVSTGAGYQENPWDTDPTNSNGKSRIDARIQLSRTPDGQQILYTWAESDTSFTDNQKRFNVLPNVKMRLYDVASNKLHPDEIDVTSDAVGEIANRAMYHFISPKFKLVSKVGENFTVNIPMTISNSNPYAQRTANIHWFSCATLDFKARGVGIAKNTADLSNDASIFPNPAKTNATVKMSLTSSSKIQVEVLNTIGQVVKTVIVQGQAGSNSVNVDLNGLSSGIYLVNIKADKTSSTKKLIIE